MDDSGEVWHTVTDTSTLPLISKKITNHCSKLPVNPMFSSLQNNLVWHTESKAFWKSIFATATDDLFIKAQVQSFIQLNILVTVDFLARNYVCLLYTSPSPRD